MHKLLQDQNDDLEGNLEYFFGNVTDNLLSFSCKSFIFTHVDWIDSISSNRPPIEQAKNVICPVQSHQILSLQNQVLSHLNSKIVTLWVPYPVLLLVL